MKTNTLTEALRQNGGCGTADIRTNPPIFMNETELAKVIGISVRSLRNHTKAGLIPRIKIGRRVIFRWPQVEAALAQLEGK